MHSRTVAFAAFALMCFSYYGIQAAPVGNSADDSLTLRSTLVHINDMDRTLSLDVDAMDHTTSDNRVSHEAFSMTKRDGQQQQPANPLAGLTGAADSGTQLVTNPVTGITDPPVSNILTGANMVKDGATSPLGVVNSGGVGPTLDGIKSQLTGAKQGD